MSRPRYIFKPAAIEARRDRAGVVINDELAAVRCGNCAHAMDKHGDRQIAWCGLYRFMTGTTTPVLCDGYIPGESS